jgi:hypothetical protein
MVTEIGIVWVFYAAHAALLAAVSRKPPTRTCPASILPKFLPNLAKSFRYP